MANRIWTGIVAAALLGAVSAHAQGTSTTTTKTQTTTNTQTKSWKSPDGTRGGSSSNTTTSTRSQSTTIGKPSPGARPQPAPHNYGGVSAVQSVAGGWNATDRGGRCSVQLYANMESGGGATSSGCKSDIAGIGNWALRGNTLMLIKNIFTTAATLHRTGPSRFDGTTASGEPISLWR